VIIAAAALVIKFTGFYQIDPLGMLFGVVLLRASRAVLRKLRIFYCIRFLLILIWKK